MPTLIRLFLALVVLAGLGFAGMIALTVMVDPGERDITIKIPARELAPADGPTIIDVNNLPAPVNVVPRQESSEPQGVETSTDASGVKTVVVPE